MPQQRPQFAPCWWNSRFGEELTTLHPDPGKFFTYLQTDTPTEHDLSNPGASVIAVQAIAWLPTAGIIRITLVGQTKVHFRQPIQVTGSTMINPFLIPTMALTGQPESGTKMQTPILTGMSP